MTTGVKIASTARLQKCFSLALVFCITFAFWAVAGAPVAVANESFTVSFGQQEEAKTIGDLKPRVIPYEKQTAPDVSIQYVMKRYRKLFEKASTPAVRIEALNRLNNLSASYGIVEKDLTIDPYVEAEVILDTYQHITDTGEEYQRMDELLYLTAKATYFTGETLEAIKRLELLVGLYPDSELTEEALFRLAEMHFELAEFNSAKTYYQRLLKETEAPNLRRFGLYKLAWSQFRLDDRDGTFASLSELIAEYPRASEVNRSTPIAAIEEPESKFRGFDLPQATRIFPDTMRLFAIAGLQESGDGNQVKQLASLLGGDSFQGLTLVALTDHLERKDRGIAAANLTRDYLDGLTPSLATYPYAQYVIDTLLKWDGTVEAWKQKAVLAEEYGVRSAFWQGLDQEGRASVRDQLITVTEELAHLNYVRMQKREERDQLFIKHAVSSADYYLQLAELDLNVGRSDDYKYLSAQAFDQAGRLENALQLYDELAYAGIAESTGSGKANPRFAKAAESAYKGLLAYKALDAKQNQATWSSQRIAATQRFLLHHGTHAEAPNVAQNLADQFIQAGESQRAITALALLETLPTANQKQRFLSLQQRAQLYYNAADFSNAEQHYRLALTALNNFDTNDISLSSSLLNGVANSIYKQAELESDSAIAKDHYLRVADEFPNHELASAALYNAASYYHENLAWTESIKTHERFIAQYPNHTLRSDARKKLITAFQKTDQLNLAAFNLMELARSVQAVDAETATSSAYQAAVYYKELGKVQDATDAFNWFIAEAPKSYAQVSEGLYFFFEQANLEEDRLRAAYKVVQHIEKNDLDDPRSKTIGAETALVLARAEQDAFEAIPLSLPFDKSIKTKTKQLQSCTRAYERVMEFGVAEYVSAARFNMAYIYQSLAHDIMNSERPNGLSELELEQYEILLEEQAIPIEEQAIALHENNIRTDGAEEVNEWVLQSFTALAALNPSLYERPIIGPSYAEDIH